MTELLTVDEMAAQLRVSRATVYRLLLNRRIPGAFRLGRLGAWRIPETALEEWIQEMSNDKLKKDRSEQ